MRNASSPARWAVVVAGVLAGSAVLGGILFIPPLLSGLSSPSSDVDYIGSAGIARPGVSDSAVVYELDPHGAFSSMVGGATEIRLVKAGEKVGRRAERCCGRALTPNQRQSHGMVSTRSSYRSNGRDMSKSFKCTRAEVRSRSRSGWNLVKVQRIARR
jgi:hypothetical protein